MKRNFSKPLVTLLVAIIFYSSAAALNVSGVVWRDQNNDGLFNTGEGTNASGPLYVNLVNPAGAFVSSAAVSNNGSYTLTGVANNSVNFKLVLTNTPTNTYGNRLPATSYSVAETIGTGNSATQTESVAGEITLTTGTQNTTGQNFQINILQPFNCESGIAYQVARANNENASSLYSYHVVTGDRALISPLNATVNALIFSDVDNTLWAMRSNYLVRIGADGTTTEYLVQNLIQGANCASSLPGGYMLVYNQRGTKYFVIDIDSKRETYLRLVDPKNNYALQTGPEYGTTLNVTLDVADLAYDINKKLLFAIETNTGKIASLDPFTGISNINVNEVSRLPKENYGAIFTDRTGNLYAFANSQGTFWQIAHTTNTAVQLSQSIPSGNNDGASCLNANLVDMPFTCDDGTAYQTVNSTVNNTSSLFGYNVSSGVHTLIATLPFRVNGLIYNSLDNMLWAAKTGTSDIVKIDGSGSVTSFSIANLATGSNVGAELPNGYMLISNGIQAKYFVVDIDPDRSTYLKLVDPTAGFSLQTGPDYGVAISSVLNISDIAFVSKDQLCYGITTGGQIATLNPFTGSVSVVAAAVNGLPQDGGSYGAVFSDISGRLYAFHNPSGAFYLVHPTTNSASLISTTAPSNNNDGASCANTSLADLPFNCAEGVTYQVAASSSDATSSLYSYNVSTGVRTLIAPLPFSVNGLIYNSLDDMLWGSVNTSIVRIDRQGGTKVFPIANLPVANSPVERSHYNVGAELPNGYMLLYRYNQDIQPSKYYVIDIDPNRATYLQLVDPTAGFVLKTGPDYGTLVNSTVPFNIADIAFVTNSQLCYAITPEGILASLDPFTGNVVYGATQVSGLPLGTYGAIVSDVTGRLYAFHNNSGTYYRISTATNLATSISTSTPSGNNDGASCANTMMENLPFACEESTTYQVAAAPDDSVSSLYALNVSTNVRTLVARLPYLVNALVYNSADDMLWASVSGSNKIARIDREGGAVVHEITNLPNGYNIGVELPNGYMMLSSSNSSNYYVVDINSTRPTYLRLVDPTAGFIPKTGPSYGTAVNSSLDVSDIAFVTRSQLTYGITTQAKLASLNVFTGGVVVNETAVSGLPTGGYGAVVTDASGLLYAFHNGSGQFYRIDIATNTANLMATFTPSGRNDGANCSTAMLCNISISEPNTLSPTVCANIPITISVTASNSGTGTITFQWQVSRDNGSSWSNISAGDVNNEDGVYSGAETATLTVTPKNSAWNGSQYRVLTHGDICTLTSSVSTLNINTPQQCGSLPVTLSTFKVTKEENGSNRIAILDWTTTEESNSDRFEIEKSQDGKNWKLIGIELSQGESNILKSYMLTDHSPAKGTNYYRLKMIDKNDTFAYSRILAAEFGTALLIAYPNPVNEKLFLSNYAKVKQVIIYNAAGLKVIVLQAINSEGIDISKLDAGLYSVSIILTDGTISKHKVAVAR